MLKNTIGTFINQGNATNVEIAALTGFDYVVIDCEHGLYNVRELTEMLRAAKARGIKALARIPMPTREWILRALDAGADGLIIPNIRTMEEVHTIVRYGRYAPLGQRGFAAVRGADYGYNKEHKEFHAMQQHANNTVLLLPQCETVESLVLADEILEVEGIDGLFVGPYDLSSSMEMMGDFENPRFKKAIASILESCQKAGKLSMIFTMQAEKGNEYRAQGFDSVSVGMDYMVLGQGYTHILRQMGRE